MRVFFSSLAFLFLFSFIAPLASANGIGDEDCKNSALCACIKNGTCGHARGRADCVVKISAPTFGGKVALDIRDESGKSRFPDGPRTKTVGAGIVSFGVGCHYLQPPTAEVYLCVDGKIVGTPNAVSIRWRHKGDLDTVVVTRKLHMCLKGDQCERFIPGDPPRK